MMRLLAGLASFLCRNAKGCVLIGLSIACISHAYAHGWEIALKATPPISEGEEPGDNDKLCEAMLLRLKEIVPLNKSANRTDTNECAYAAALSLEGLEEPEWQEINLNQNRSLLIRAALYLDVGKLYKELEDGLQNNAAKNHHLKRAATTVELFEKDGGKIFITKQNLLQNLTRREEMFKGEGQNLVRFLYSPSSKDGKNERCPSLSAVGSQENLLVYVNHDLSQPNIKTLPISDTIIASVVKRYNGKAYFIQMQNGTLSLISDEPWGLTRFCEITKQ